MGTTKGEVWGYANCKDAELWTQAGETREEAIAEALSEIGARK